METLIRRRVLRRLIWVRAVCICPTKRTLGLNGLNCIPEKNCSKKIDFEKKNQQTTKSMQNYPVGKELRLFPGNPLF